MPGSPAIDSSRSKRCGVSARPPSSSPNDARKRQLMQNLSPPMVESRREPHCAQTDCVAPEAMAGAPSPAREARALPGSFVFMRLALKHCKDNAALRRSRAALKPCERSRCAQFRDNAAVAYGRASLLLLWGAPSERICHRKMEER